MSTSNEVLCTYCKKEIRGQPRYDEDGNIFCPWGGKLQTDCMSKWYLMVKWQDCQDTKYLDEV